MNDALEQVWIDVFDDGEILVGHSGVRRKAIPKFETGREAESYRVCEIMAEAIAHEIKSAYKDEHVAAVIALRLSCAILSGIKEKTDALND